MQYILTQEELDGLHKRAKIGDEAPSKESLQSFCTMVADKLPLEEGWQKGVPWGCILTKGNDDWYCDDCPAQEICPYKYKSWSQ